jgi:predicted ester cyclase
VLDSPAVHSTARAPDAAALEIRHWESWSMSSIRETAERFFDACETGKGGEVCAAFCRPDATFSAQAGALEGVDTLEGYTEWMKGLFTPVPDGRYELLAFAVDPERNNVSAYAVFRGTHTGEGGPVPPTGKAVEADYVYVMDFDGDRIRHMTKIWNDGISLQQLGWA